MLVEAKTEGKNLVITLSLEPGFPLSSTGKSKVVATTHGNQPTPLQIDGKPVIVGVNAYIRN